MSLECLGFAQNTPTLFAWIALHAPNGRWEWIDGTPFNYANWAPGGEANCGDKTKDCHVGILVNSDYGKWWGYNQDANDQFVCSRPANY